MGFRYRPGSNTVPFEQVPRFHRVPKHNKSLINLDNLYSYHPLISFFKFVAISLHICKINNDKYKLNLIAHYNSIKLRIPSNTRQKLCIFRVFVLHCVVSIVDDWVTYLIIIIRSI